MKDIFSMAIKFIFIVSFLLVGQHVYATIRIQLKWEHQFQFAGYYMAIEKGYYTDKNLDIEIIEGNSEIDTITSVLNGEAEMGISNTELLLRRNEGSPVVALLAIYQHSPLVFLARKKTDIHNIHDIVGKKVMLEKQRMELEAYLKNEKIDIETVIKYPYKANALIDNADIDFTSAYFTDEPYLLIERGIDYQIFNPQSAGIDFYEDILFTSEKYIKDNLKDIENFMEATKKGWIYALDNIEETIDVIYNKYSSRKDKEHLRFEAQESKKLIYSDENREIGYMYSGRWDGIGKTYVELGLLNPDFKVDKLIYSKGDYVRLNIWIYFLFGGLAVILILILILLSFGVKFSKIKITAKISILKKAEKK